MPLSNDLPTIYTVARQAGVSVATVSRVLRGSPHTSEEARERVQAAVAAVGYSPLRRTRGRPVTHGVVVPNLAERAWTEFLLGLQSPAGSDARDDVRVARMVLACDEIGGPGDVDDAVEALADRTNGLVICQATASDELVARLASEQPVVLVGRGQLPGCDLLDIDQRSPIAELVAGLFQLGLRRTLFVGDKAAGQAIGGGKPPCVQPWRTSVLRRHCRRCRWRPMRRAPMRRCRACWRRSARWTWQSVPPMNWRCGCCTCWCGAGCASRRTSRWSAGAVQRPPTTWCPGSPRSATAAGNSASSPRPGYGHGWLAMTLVTSRRRCVVRWSGGRAPAGLDDQSGARSG